MSRPKPFRDSGGLDGDTLSIRFLEDRGQDQMDVVGWLADFIAGARDSLDIAIYDCRLNNEAARMIAGVLAERLSAGVTIRLVYDAGRKPQSAKGIDAVGADPAELNTDERVRELRLPDECTRAVTSAHGLMHHKFFVRDRRDIWTGSLNITDDAMSRMENIILQVESPRLAELFGRDFAALWETQRIEVSGAFQTEPELLQFDGQPALTDVDFSPGQGEQINEWVAAKVLGARRRIVFCSMLFNSSKLLRALMSQLDRGEIEVWGLYDHTQMSEVLDQWRAIPEIAWKIEAVQRLIRDGQLVGKRSDPYRPGHSHNFMHNKTLVIDNTVVTGSYNLSHAAQSNAENMLAIESPALAARVIAYTRHLVDRYDQKQD